MNYHVIIGRSAEKALSRIPESGRKKIYRKLVNLAQDPYIGKKLKGELQERYTIRVWPYRILYRIEKKIVTVFVLEIGHRQGIYK